MLRESKMNKIQFAENRTLRNRLFHDLPEYFDESAIVSEHVGRAVKLTNEEFKRALEQLLAEKTNEHEGTL